MSNKGADFYIRTTFKVIRKVIISLLSWLLELCGGNPSSVKQDVSNNQSQFSNQAFESQMKTMQTQINKLNQTISSLNQKLTFTQEEVKELRLRLNSITGEVLDDMEKLRKELLRQMKTEIESQLTSFDHGGEKLVPQQDTDKLFFESSSDGMMLINMMKTNSVSSNFIELCSSDGKFSIVQSEKCIDYILANRDYALGACEVHVNTATPSIIRVDECGYAEQMNNSNDWKVIRKAKITLL